MSVNTLHITNGDSVLHTWKKAGLLGTHLAWKDVLHEGPVPGGLPLEALSRVRADYLSSRRYGNAIKIYRDLEKRDALLRRAGEFDEIVLWFEHDLYDQLHVLQILEALDEINIGAGGVQIVQSDHFLGMMTPEELLALYPKRKYITASCTRGAKQAWNAFVSQTPDALADAARVDYAGLPFLRDALHRLCEEYPWADSGLSRTQKQLLEACAQGARRKEELFRKSQAREEAPFLGDMASAAAVDDLCAEPAPLLSALDQGYELTVLGRRVLAGDADWLEHAPPDRWIGGVHITAQQEWRWDEQTRAFGTKSQGGAGAER